MKCSILSALVLLAGCVHLDPVEPTPPVDPGPPPVEGSACERSCERRTQLACAPAIPNCVEACDASDALGLAYSWQPEIQSRALSCEEWDDIATRAR